MTLHNACVFLPATVIFSHIAKVTSSFKRKNYFIFFAARLIKVIKSETEHLQANRTHFTIQGLRTSVFRDQTALRSNVADQSPFASVVTKNRKLTASCMAISQMRCRMDRTGNSITRNHRQAQHDSPHWKTNSERSIRASVAFTLVHIQAIEQHLGLLM